MTITIKESKILPGAIDIHNITDFNLTHIFECGQCFRWNPFNGGYSGCAGGVAAELYFEAEEKGVLTIKSSGGVNDVNFWCDYLDLERDYGEIKRELAKKDRFLAASVEYGYGIRLLKQELFETLISFILSANNNIPRIKGCVEKISGSYGIELNQSVYSFPSPEAMSRATAEDISDCCHAGYRCAYIEKTSRDFLKKPIDADILKNAAIDDARKMLREYSGVGPKVADCILLFTGAHTEAFPIDVWIKRVMEELYFGREAKMNEISEFAQTHFGKLAGFAQQYLFYYAREHMDNLRNII